MSRTLQSTQTVALGWQSSRYASYAGSFHAKDREGSLATLMFNGFRTGQLRVVVYRADDILPPEPLNTM